MVVFRPSDSLSRPRLFVKAERPSPKYSRKLMAFSACPVERRCLLRRPSDPNRPHWPPTSRCAARRRHYTTGSFGDTCMCRCACNLRTSEDWIRFCHIKMGWSSFWRSILIFYLYTYITCLFENSTYLKVRKNRKADWRAVDSPKKWTNEFDLFAVKSKKANKINSFVRFLGEVSRP